MPRGKHAINRKNKTVTSRINNTEITPKRTETSKRTESAKRSELLGRTKSSRKAQFSREIEPSRKIDSSRGTESSKATEYSRGTEFSKAIEYSRGIESPRETESLRRARTSKNRKKRKKISEETKQGFLQGVLTLMFSQILIKLLGMVYTLYLTNREGFGDEGNGIVSSSYQIYAMLLTISSTGVPNAISKLISERVAVGDHKGAHRIFKIAFATFAVIGLVGSLMLFFGAGLISKQWLQIPEAEMTMVALSPAIFFVAISSVMRGYFNGRQNVKATARSQTLEQVFKTATTIIIVEIVAILSNVSTEWMAAGATLATTLATFAGFGYLFLYYKTIRKEVAREIKSTVNYKYERVKTIIKRILVVSIPIALTAIMSSLNKNIDSFTVVRSLKEFLPESEALAQYRNTRWESRYVNKPATFNKCSICYSLSSSNICS